VPGIPGLTENIHIHSIVGRYLEHARIFAFGQGEGTKLYIASADWMTRNTENRVEIACPIEKQELKDQILRMFDVQFHDTKKGRRIGPDGRYHHIRPDRGEDAQAVFMKMAKERVR